MTEFGKDKCEYLRNIRVRLAKENGIAYEPAECTHEGNCPGFCPVCDKEMEYITQKLEEKVSRGEPVKLSGILVADTKMPNYQSDTPDAEGDIRLEGIEDDYPPLYKNQRSEGLYKPDEPDDIGSIDGMVDVTEEIRRETFSEKKHKRAVPTKDLTYTLKIAENLKFRNLPSADPTQIAIPLVKLIRIFDLKVKNTLVIDNIVDYESRWYISPSNGNVYVYSIQMYEGEVIFLAKSKSENINRPTCKNLLQIIDKSVKASLDREFFENPDTIPKKIYVESNMALRVLYSE